MAFDLVGARNEGYQDTEIITFLANRNPDFDINGALDEGYTLDQVNDFLNKKDERETQEAIQKRDELLALEPLKTPEVTQADIGFETAEPATTAVSPEFAQVEREAAKEKVPIQPLKTSFETVKGMVRAPFALKETSEEVEQLKLGKKIDELELELEELEGKPEFLNIFKAASKKVKLDKLKKANESSQRAANISRQILKQEWLQPDESIKKPQGVAGFVQDVIRAAPQIAAQIGATATTGGLGGAVFMGTQIAGGKAEELKKKGIEPDRSLKASLSSAVFQAPLEQLPMIKLLRKWTPTGSVLKAIKGVTDQMGAEFVTEFAQKYPDAAVDIWAETKGKGVKERTEEFFKQLPDITNAAFNEGLVASVFGGLGGAVKVGIGETQVEPAVQEVALGIQEAQPEQFIAGEVVEPTPITEITPTEEPTVVTEEVTAEEAPVITEEAPVTEEVVEPAAVEPVAEEAKPGERRVESEPVTQEEFKEDQKDTGLKTMTFEEFEAIEDPVERRRVFEANPVTEKPGQRQYDRVFKEKSENYTKPVLVMFGDINGLKKYNDEILGAKGTDILNGEMYETIATKTGRDVTSNLHGDEYGIIINSVEEGRNAIKSAMEDVANIEVTDKDGKRVKPTMTWLIAELDPTKDLIQQYKDIEKRVKKVGKNRIGVDITIPENYTTIKGAEIPDSEIVTREVKSEDTIPEGDVRETEERPRVQEVPKEVPTTKPKAKPATKPAKVKPVAPKKEVAPTVTDEEAEAGIKFKHPPGVVAAGQLAVTQKLPEKAPGVNLKKIINEDLDRLGVDDEVNDIKRFVLKTADEFAPEIDKARRGKIKLEETKRMADRLGMTEKSLLRRGVGKAFNAEQLVRAQDILTTSADRVVKKQKALADKGLGNVTDQDMAEFQADIQRHAAIQAEFAGARAEAGRALRALSIISKSLGEKNFDKILDATGGRDLNRKVIEKIIAIDPENERAVNVFTRGMAKASFPDMINEYWINSILSAPTTHIVNVTSNILTGLSKPLLETPTAATLSAIESLATGKERKIFFREIPSSLIGAAKGVPEGIRTAIKSFVTEQPEFDKQTKLENMRFRAIPGKAGKIIRTPGRALMAADEFFKHVIYRAQINQDAYRMARREGLKGENFTKRFGELVNNPSEVMMKKAREEAEHRTFTNPLGQMGNKIMSLRSDFISKDGKRILNPMKFIIPFVKTPTNIAKFAFERTPVGFIPKVSKIIKKEITNEQISEELAKPLMGSIIMGTAALLASQGFITGAGPKDKRKREALYRTGWQPYSLKLGDKYYSFARLEPLGSLFGMAADFATFKGTEAEKETLFERMVYSVSKNLVSKTYLNGLSNALDAIFDFDRFGKRWINNMAGSLIPNVIASGSRATQDELKKVKGLVDTYKSKFPDPVVEMLSEQKLYPLRTIWGNPVDRAGNFWTRFLSPIQYSAAKGSKIDEELVRLDLGIALPSQNLNVGKENAKRFGLDVDNIKMTGREYDKFQEAAGKIAKRRVLNLMVTKEYGNASDQTKRELIRNEISKARRLARKSFFKVVAIRFLKEKKEA